MGYIWTEVVLIYFTAATNHSLITVAARSTAQTVFARSNAGIVGSNTTQGMDVCVRLFFGLFCV
jgi:hypothetical protein